MLITKTVFLKSLKLMLLLIVFRALLDFGYWKFVSPLYDYSGFKFQFDVLKYLLSWVAIFIIFFVINIKQQNKLIYIYFLIYAINILPMSSYYALSGSGSLSFWLNCIVFLTCILFLPRFKKHDYVNFEFKGVQKLLFYILAIFCFINLIYLIYASGGKFVLLFSDVYDFRSENLDSYSGVWGYLNNWSVKILVPFLIAVSFFTKRIVFLICSIMLCILFYAFTGHKSVLMPLILCFFLSITFSSNTTEGYFYKFSILSLLGLIFFSTLGVVLYHFFNNIIFASIFFRRAFFIPAYINDVYFEMFSNDYENVYWSNSIFSSFLEYPYGDIQIVKVVGAYLNSPDMGANTGFVASGFMQASYWGILFYTLIVIVINYYLSYISNKVNPIVFNSILIMPFLALFTSSDLFTSMLTHGLFLSILLVYLYSGIFKLKS